jgi:hypothetical protein
MNDLECKTGILIIAESDLSSEPAPKNITIIPAYKYLMMNPSQQKEFIFENNFTV